MKMIPLFLFVLVSLSIALSCARLDQKDGRSIASTNKKLTPQEFYYYGTEPKEYDFDSMQNDSRAQDQDEARAAE